MTLAIIWRFTDGSITAGVVKLVDAGDSKSPGSNTMSVLFRPPACIDFNVQGELVEVASSFSIGLVDLNLMGKFADEYLSLLWRCRIKS